jgi:hypothetical protein
VDFHLLLLVGLPTHYQPAEMMTLPSFRAVGIARGVGGAAARDTKTHTNGPTPAERSGIGVVGMKR